MAAITNYAERYRQGEYEQVWDELVALGEGVREEPVYADAYEVARETMRRVRNNIGILIPRLRGLGYEFGYGWAISRKILAAEHVREFEMEQPLFTPAPSGVAEFISELERRAGMLPLSLRAFYEVVGGVNFVGAHPEWDSPRLDPLEVLSARSALDLDEWMYWSDDRREDGACELPISPDQYFKYLYSGGGPYAIPLGVPAADAPLLYERHHTTFVNYLRICFHWGGFPGWDQGDAPPKGVLAALREDLLPL